MGVNGVQLKFYVNMFAASLFTTQSINAMSTKIRSQLPGGTANFVLGRGGERTVFPLSGVRPR